MQRSPLILVGAAALALTLAACGDDDTAEPPSTTGGGAATSAVTVHGTDALKFDATEYEAEAGEVEFTYVNDGSVAHTLLIKDVDGFKLSVGGEDEGTVELEAGTYTLYCDIAGHEAAGMEAELTVE